MNIPVESWKEHPVTELGVLIKSEFSDLKSNAPLDVSYYPMFTNSTPCKTAYPLLGIPVVDPGSKN